ncbi:MAG: TonB-dependent receptor domain-containing protein [Oceanipulchritudo sp.]
MRSLFRTVVLLLACGSLTGETVIDLAPYVVVAPSLVPVEEVMDAQSVRQARPIDLAEVLSARIPEIAMARKGPVAGDILLRGLSRDNIVVSVDEMKTFGACPNRMDPPAFHVSSQQIETVSVRAGPFSVEQGSTIGGAVLVETTPSGGPEFMRLHAFGGSHGYLAVGVTGRTQLHREAASATGGLYHQRGDVHKDGAGRRFTLLPGTNYLPENIDRRAFEISTADLKADWRLPGDVVMTFNYGYQDAVDVLYPGLKMDAMEDTMHRGSLSLEVPGFVNWADEVRISLAFSTVDHDMLDSFRESARVTSATAERGYMMRTTSETAYTGFSASAAVAGMKWKFRYGIDATERKWDAGNVIMMLTNDMLPDVLVNQAGAWAVYEHREGPTAIEIGARLDRARGKARDDISFVQELRGTTANRAEDTLPAAYFLAERKLGRHWRLYGGVGHARRLPDPQERYINLDRPVTKPDWIGNPELEPVRTTECQAGANWQDGNWQSELSLFHAWLGDFIYLDSLETDDGMATTYTALDARLYGATLDLRWRGSDAWTLEAGAAWQEGVKETRTAGATNDRLAEIPPLRGRVAAVWQQGDWAIRLDGLFQARHDRVDPDLQEQELAGWMVWNCNASWTATDWLSLTAGIDNLFDKAYAASNSYVRDPFRSGVLVTEPGRTWYARITAEW